MPFGLPFNKHGHIYTYLALTIRELKNLCFYSKHAFTVLQPLCVNRFTTNKFQLPNSQCTIYSVLTPPTLSCIVLIYHITLSLYVPILCWVDSVQQSPVFVLFTTTVHLIRYFRWSTIQLLIL